MAHLDLNEAFEDFRDRVFDGIRGHFPMRGKKQTLYLDGVEVTDNLRADDLRAQHDARVSGKSFTVPVYGTIRLVDNDTGKLVDKRRLRLADLPKQTQRYSYLLEGKEYQIDNQWQLKPGAYTRRRQNGELETRFNVTGGRPFDVTFDPESKKFLLEYNKAKLPLHPLLKTLGVDEETMERELGKDVVTANREARGAANTLEKFYKTDTKKAPESREQAATRFVEAMRESKMRPEATAVTLGAPHDHVDGSALLSSAKKLLKVQSGHPEDDRDSLLFKDLRAAGDFAHDKIAAAKKIVAAKAARRLNDATDVRDILKFDYFNDPIRDAFKKNAAARLATQINPVEMVASSMQTTVMGPGGIQSEQQVVDETKFVNVSHLGYLDPITTPEGCFDAETQVFTSEGWKFWPEVGRETQFACLVGGRLEFHPPQALQAYRYQGRMLGLRKPQLEYLVTPNHRMLCRPNDKGAKFRVCEAQEMHGKIRNFRVSHEPAVGSSSKWFALPFVAGNNSSKNVGSIDLIDWAEFLGWFLSEGHVHYAETTSSYLVDLFQSEVNATCCRRIEALLDRLPFQWSKTERDHGRNKYTIGVKQLAHYLSQFGLSHEKFLPEEVFSWSIPARRVLLESLMLGDGRITFDHKRPKQDSAVYTTTSHRLALGVERLIISLGSGATLHTYPDIRGYRTVYEVFHLRKKETTTQPTGRAKRNPFYSLEYDGVVYCASVPGTFLYVRRNGKHPMWLGNSKTGITLRLPIGVRKVGHEVHIPLYNLKTGKTELVPPSTFMESGVVLPDQVTWKDGRPRPVGKTVKMAGRGNDVTEGSFSEAQYVMRHPSQLFGITTNLIPFMPNTSGNRASMASRHIEQAISLLHREAPLVQVGTGVDEPGLRSFEQVLGSQTSHRAPFDGTVKSVKPGSIIVRADDGKEHEVQTYNNYPLNDAKSVLHAMASVKPGDQVRAGQVVADTNFSKGGTLALGTNLLAAFIPYKGYNFEDGVVISETAAKKLSSVHLHKHKLATEEGLIFDRAKFEAQHPGLYKRDQLAHIGEDGLPKVGARVKPGDPLVLATKKFDAKGRLGLAIARKSISGAHVDKSLQWDGETEGEVTGVTPTKDGIQVHVRTVEPLQVGDKIAGRHGNKGVVAYILPDKEMPHLKDGRHVEVALNPSGVPGRMNIGQVLETVASKIAEKTGAPYVVPSFPHDVDMIAHVKKELKQHDLQDAEELHDPVTGQSLGKALVGKHHILKLVHQVDKKTAVASGMAGSSGYDINLQPKEGQRAGALGVYALLAHGAVANLREMATWKSEGPDMQADRSKAWPSQHADVWARIQTGQPLPTPKPTFAFKKFEALLKGAGVNIEKHGHEHILSPITDKQILEMTGDRMLTKPAERLDAKVDKATGELKPRPGGIFDTKLTGGHGGMLWSRIKLAEPVPNPVFEAPICALTGLSKKDFDAVMDGEKGVTQLGDLAAVGHGVMTGGRAIEHLLKRIDVPKELEQAKSALNRAKGDAVDKSLKKVKYLQALYGLGLKAHEAYVLNHLPVIPPAMRPASLMADGNIKYADVNELYSQFAQVNAQLADQTLAKNLTDKGKSGLRANFYDGVKAITGYGIPYKQAEHKGLLHQIAGSSPKVGLFQRTLIQKRQDLTMRSTIIPEPALGLDEVGLPRKHALDLYEPFVVQKLQEMGVAKTPLDAIEYLKSRKASPNAVINKALEKAMADRPVLLKRDPALHKYSVQGFQPKIVEGNAIKIHPLVCGGFCADFDGNCYIGSTRLVVKFRYNPPKEAPLAALEVTYSMKFSATSRILCRDESSVLVEMTLEEFPRIDGTGVLDRNGATVIQVPPGVEVMSYDHLSGLPVFAEVTHLTVEDNCPTATVRTRRFEVTASRNESLCVYDHETEEVRDLCPKDAVGRLSPFIKKIPSEGYWGEFEEGWLLGAYVSDGFVSRETVGYTKQSNAHRDRFYAALCALNKAPVGRFTYAEEHGPDASIKGRSVKDHYSNVRGETLELLRSLHGVRGPEGRACLRKALPSEFLLTLSKACLLGLLSGLFDGDGSLSVSHSKRTPQVLASYSTSSPALADSVQLLAQLLGIRSSSTPYEPKPGRLQKHTAYIVSFSTNDLREYAPHLRVLSSSANEALTLLQAQAGSKDDLDIVPVPARIMYLVASKMGPCAGHPSLQHSLAVAKSARKKGWYVSRTTARRVLAILREAGVSADRWAQVVEATDVNWDVVEEVTDQPAQTVYDLVVPSTKVFAVNGGLVVWDTMSVFVPIGREAIAEAHRMKPTNNLFSEASGKVVYQPTLESALGLYKLSVVGKDSGKSFDNAAHALEAARGGKLGPTEVVTVGGKRTTVGRVLLATALPETLHEKVLHDLDFRVDRKGLDKVLTQLGREHQKGESSFDKHVNLLKDVGNGASFGSVALDLPHRVAANIKDPTKNVFIPVGTHSFTLDDFAADKEVRSRVLDPAHAAAERVRHSKATQTEKDRQVVGIYLEADKKMRKLHEEKLSQNPTNLFTMYQAGVKPGWDQYKQMVLGPMLLRNSANQIIPTPVTRSYGEGLDVAGYWTQMHGARRGSVMKVQEVQEPGYMSKLLMNNTMHLGIAERDCGTKRGVNLPLIRPDGKPELDVHDRALATDHQFGDLHLPAGTEVTPEITARVLRHDPKASLHVRSPLTCEHEKGICQHCMGLGSDGKHYDVGTNVGVMAAQTVGERSVQLTLKAFHEGGAVTQGGGRLLNSFARFEQLTKLPKTIPDAASLALRAGRVESVGHTPTGVNVVIGGQTHFVGRDAAGNPLHLPLPGSPWSGIKVGDHVEAGQNLSDPGRTYVNPHDLYRATNSIDRVHDHLATEIYDLYKDEGIKRRHVETVVRAMGGTTKVTDPGDAEGILRGEFQPLAAVQKVNAALQQQGKAPIEHTPVLKGIDVLPLLAQEDWMARLQHLKLRTTIADSAAVGAKSNLHSTHPIPGLAYGSEFGLTSAHAHTPGLAHLRNVPAHHYLAPRSDRA